MSNPHNIYQFETTLEKKKNYLFNVLISADDLDEFLDSLAQFLGTPICLLTPSFTVIACSRIHKVDDIVWNHTMNTGYYPDYAVGYIAKHHRAWDISHRFGELYERTLPYSEKKRLICNLWHREEYIGSIVTLIIGAMLSDDDRELLLFARDILQRILAFGGQITSRRGTAQEVLLIEILSGRPLNKETHYNRYLYDSIGNHKHFMLINVEFLTPDKISEAISPIKILFSQATVFVFNTRLLIFIKEEPPIEINESVLATFKELLTCYNATAFFSDEFDDLLRTREFYEKNVRLGKIFIILKDTRPVIHYDEFKFYDMYLQAIKSIGNKPEADSFICRKVYEIYLYDIEHKTQYVNTLWSYLRAKESVSEAGKIMYVHRNTIAYRISRIKELFKLDLACADNHFRIYYSCCILRFYENMRNNDDVSWEED